MKQSNHRFRLQLLALWCHKYDLLTWCKVYKFTYECFCLIHIGKHVQIFNNAHVDIAVDSVLWIFVDSAFGLVLRVCNYHCWLSWSDQCILISFVPCLVAHVLVFFLKIKLVWFLVELVFSLNLAHKRLQTFSSCYFQLQDVDDLCYWESICVVPNGSGILNKNQFTSGAKQFIHPNLSLFQNLHVVSELSCLSCPSWCSCFVLGLSLFGSKWTWYLLLIQFTWGAKHFNPSVHLFYEVEVFF